MPDGMGARIGDIKVKDFNANGNLRVSYYKPMQFGHGEPPLRGGWLIDGYTLEVNDAGLTVRACIRDPGRPLGAWKCT